MENIKPGDILVRISGGWILIVLEVESVNYMFQKINFLNTRGEIRTMLFDDVDLQQFNVIASGVPIC